MFAELVFAYYLTSNVPAHLYDTAGPRLQQEVRLNLEQDIYDRYYIILSPYVQSSQHGVGGVTGAGAEFTIGVKLWEGVKIEFYHHSSHDTDHSGYGPMELDGIQIRIQLR